MNSQKTIRFVAGYRAFYGADYILYSIKSIYEHVEKIVIAISRIQYTPSFRQYKPDITKELIRKFPDRDKKIDVIEGLWGTKRFWLKADDIKKIEAEHGSAILNYIKENYPQLNYLLILDTDEILTEEGITAIKKTAEEHPEISGFRMAYRTYWKGLHYITDEENFHTQPIMAKITPDLMFTTIREINKKDIFTLPRNIYYHHLSYAKSSKEIFKKIQTFGHAKEIRKNWYKDVWKTWDKNRDMKNLHPLFDGSWWPRTIKISDEEIPNILRAHPYFPYETVDDFEKAMQDKIKPIDLWIPHG